MLRARRDGFDARLLQPGLHIGERVGERQRAPHDARSGRDPDERQDNDPRQPDRRPAGEHLLQPWPGSPVLGESASIA
jgi:hypothetical protein